MEIIILPVNVQQCGVSAIAIQALFTWFQRLFTRNVLVNVRVLVVPECTPDLLAARRRLVRSGAGGGGGCLAHDRERRAVHEEAGLDLDANDDRVAVAEDELRHHAQPAREHSERTHLRLPRALELLAACDELATIECTRTRRLLRGPRWVCNLANVQSKTRSRERKRISRSLTGILWICRTGDKWCLLWKCALRARWRVPVRRAPLSRRKRESRPICRGSRRIPYP